MLQSKHYTLAPGKSTSGRERMGLEVGVSALLRRGFLYCPHGSYALVTKKGEALLRRSL